MDQLIAELKDPVCIDIASLRLNGNNNKIVSVVKTINQDNLFNTIEKTIQERLSQNENFIVIFEDSHTLQKYIQTSAFITTSEKRNCITFDDFS